MPLSAPPNHAAANAVMPMVALQERLSGQTELVAEPVKVRFALERDQDGWPPAESEALWAEPVSNGLYRLDNTPWFIRDVAADDIVSAEPDEQGVMWFQSVRERGGRLVVRVIPRGDGPLRGDRRAVIEAFEPLGVTGEGSATPVNLVALDIAPEAPLASIKALLQEGEDLGRWYFEEGSVSEVWREL
jgi:hypothetical protein